MSKEFFSSNQQETDTPDGGRLPTWTSPYPSFISQFNPDALVVWADDGYIQTAGEKKARTSSGLGSTAIGELRDTLSPTQG